MSKALSELLAKVETDLAKSPAFFVSFKEWQGYKRGVQSTIDAVRKALIAEGGEVTWREQAAEIIADTTRDLPEDMPLKERMKVVDAARPHWGGCSWPRKAWQAARRDYLVRYGYKPRTKKAKEREAAAMPLFGLDHK